MPKIRPAQIYDFTAFSRRTPTQQQPGDRLDAQFKAHADAIVDVQLAVENLAKTQPEIDVKALADEIRRHAAAELGDLRQQVANAAAIVEQSKRELACARVETDRARDVADRAEARLAAAVEKARTQAAPRDVTPPNMPLEALTPLLGPNTGGFYAGDIAGATATSADYAQVSIEWAEHLPDTIPPNILAINAISGQHWSSRWWALRAAGAFGMLAWMYMGAWPSPGPPTTPLTPTNDPIPPGAMYFDTDTGLMMVWDGSTWENIAQGPSKATTSSLYYIAAAGQTVFPLTTADRNGATFAFNQTTPEGLHAHVNGVRVEPVFDYTLDTVASTITFLRPLTLNAVVIFDVLTPASQLSPTGSVYTVMLSPIIPDGVKTVFTGLTVASNSNPVNVAKNEELLVSVDGVIQQPGVAYNANAATITFAEAPLATANVFISWFGPGPSGGGGGVADAPSDGTAYARKSAAWAHLTHGDITDWATSVPAPYVLPTASTSLLGGVKVDGSTITIAGGVISSTATGGGGGLADAPNDGTLYARKSAAWAHLAHTDITDWGATLAPYALTASIPAASSSNPIMDGAASPGGGTSWSRADHVHPSDTTKYSTTNPAGYQTAAQVTASLAPYALTTALAGYLPLTGGVVTGPVDLKVQTVAQAGANLSINRASGENCAISLTAAITAVSVTNWPASGVTGKVRLLVANTGAFAISGWPAGTKWPGGTAPTITPSGTDIILLMSDNAGATIYGSVVGQDYR